MSHYTRLEITWNDGDYVKGTLLPGDVVQAAIPFFREKRWPEDVLDDLHQAIDGKGMSHPGFNRIYALDIEDMLEHISAALPDVTFFVRAAGEEFEDFWLRELRGGMVTRALGPLEEE